MLDTLVPSSKIRVAAWADHEQGCTSLAYSYATNHLITGGKKGEIVIYDPRQSVRVALLPAHTRNVRSLAVDEANNRFYSGSSDGDVKVWNLKTLTLEETWKGHHPRVLMRAAFDRNLVGTYGVLDIAVEKDVLYTCGASDNQDNGSVKRRTIVSQQVAAQQAADAPRR